MSATSRSRAKRANLARREHRLGSRRRGILHAAARIFQEVGYERATLESIGEAVGLSKTSLYYYVRSKEELLARLFVELIERMDQEARSDASSEDTPRDRLERFVTAHVRVVCNDPSGHLLATHQDTVLGGADSELMREARRRHEARLRQILADGVSEGVFRARDVRVSTYLILGALSSVGRWYSAGGAATPEQIASGLLSMVLGGIEADGLRRNQREGTRNGR